MVDIQYLLKHICDTIEKEQRYRSFRQKNHICILFDKKKIHSIGVNYTISQGSIHSEMDAFNRLLFNPKKIKKINMLVVRVCYEHASEKKIKHTYNKNLNNKNYIPIYNLGNHRNIKTLSKLSLRSTLSNLETEITIDENNDSDPSLQNLSMNKDKITCIEKYLEQIQLSNSQFDGIRFRISKPCYHCIQHMILSCRIKNYSIKKIYYSININKIYETNIDEASINPHISSYYKMCNQSIFWNTNNINLNHSNFKLRNRIV
jgi:hypothetical protein